MPGGPNCQRSPQNSIAATFSGRSTLGLPFSSKMSPPQLRTKAFQTVHQVVPPLMPSSRMP